jgi:hypothetical protein
VAFLADKLSLSSYQKKFFLSKLSNKRHFKECGRRVMSKNINFKKLWTAMAGLMLATGVSWGQAGSTTASLTGVVIDPQQAVIPGAIVTARNLQTNTTREVKAAEDGSYVISQIPPGLYEISVQANGFSNSTVKMELTLGRTTLYDFTMTITNDPNIVIVEASSLLDQGKTESSTNNDRERIDNLPINRRNFLDFSLTSPRVTPDRTPQQGVAASSGLSFNGLPARQNNITIDGLDNNDPGPGTVRSTFSQDAVQEFQVVSDGYSAEFGKALGGVVNIVTRGGTNDVKGTLFFLNRNDSISARNAFSPNNPEFKQYQFGATLGGPVKKDKAFFFTSFERLSVKQNSVVSISNETVASARREGFLINNGPIPFGVGTTTFLARGDVKVSPNDTIYIRYNYGGTFNGAGEPFGDLITGAQVSDTNAGVQQLRDNNFAFNNTYVNPGLNLVNETRFLYARRNQDLDPIDPTGPQVNIVAPEGLVVFGRGTLLPQPKRTNTYQIIDNVTLTRGRQNIKFGIDFTYVDVPLFRVPIFPGGFATFVPLDLSPLGGPTFSAIQAFDPTRRTTQQQAFLMNLSTQLPMMIPGFPRLNLQNLGLPAAFAQGFLSKNATGTKTKSSTFSAFFQDDIKLRSNFLLKLGLRYDRNDTDFLASNSGNFSPRIAISYKPAKIGRLHLKAAYGLFFATPLFGPATVGQNTASGALKIPVIPFPLSLAFYSLPGHRLPDGDGVPAGVPFIPQLSLEFRNDPGMRPAYSQQVNAGFDYFITNNMALSITYDSVRGIKVFSQRNINPIVRPIPGDTINSAITGRVDTTRGDVFEFASAYDSYYHGLTISLNRRFSNNVGLIANYTFAKAIDNFIDIRNELQQSVDPLSLKGERGLSLQDVRSRFILSGSWDLNYTKNPFLSGFQVSSIINLESGRTYNLLAGADLNLNGDNPPGDRPAFIARNSGLTPGFARVDFRLTRTINFKENYKIQAFVEGFNIFNRVNISDVNPIFPMDAQGNFNLPAKDGSRFVAPKDRFRASFAPRQFQFGFKFSF